MSDPPGTTSPFEKHDYAPDDLHGHYFFALKDADGGPMMVWDIEEEGISPAHRLEFAEHFDALAGSLRSSYWEWAAEQKGKPHLEPGEDRAYE